MVKNRLFSNILCEFGPIIAFLIAYSVSDFRNATIAIIVATLGALILLKVLDNHLPLFALLTTATVIVFGGISLVVHVPSIFILRDTIFDVVFGVVLVVSGTLRRPVLKTLFNHVFHISDRGWVTLTYRWGLFFIALAALNEWVRLTLSADAWVVAKVLMILVTLAFGFYQFTLSRRERLPDASPWGLRV